LWNKRVTEGEPDLPQRPRPISAPTPIAINPPRPEPVTVRSEPARNVSSVAVIGPTMKVTGQIFSQEALYVDGEVDGCVDLSHSLTVGQNGKVQANIKARDVTIFGVVNGNVEANEKIAIRDKGSLIGDIRTAGIVIDDGAYFKGNIDIIRTEPVKSAAAPHPAAKTGT
jgi:cytoskeletal protein CcmA (bactofilin family)